MTPEHAIAPLLPLAALLSSDEVVIDCVTAAGPLRARLQELGLVSGARVRVIRPGSPLLLAIGDTRLALRADEADAILVQAS